jgi:cell migration-inducing and hyaluronan-binding protein
MKAAVMSIRRFDPALRNTSFRGGSVWLMIALLAGLSLTLSVAQGANAPPLAPIAIVCNGGDLPAQAILQPLPSQQPDLRVTGKCTVQPAKNYYYANVNILDKGELTFAETNGSQTDLWVSSIIIENGGAMTAGSVTNPFGTDAGILRIHIYGPASPSAIDSNGNKVPVESQGQGVPCQSGTVTIPCGIPQAVWEDNGTNLISGCGSAGARRLVPLRRPGLPAVAEPCIPGLPTTASDYFYQYGPLYGDGKVVESGPDQGKVGYFGYKTLAVSFGGTLALYGYKGASYNIPDTGTGRENSGVSWIRLANNLVEGAPSLTLSADPMGKWKAGDEIVVTTTDYLPGHSEQLKIASTYTGGTTLPLDQAFPVQWAHNGTRYGGPTSSSPWTQRLPDRIKNSIDTDLVNNGAETRAAVALLTRSIRIVSEGDTAGETFAQASSRTTCPDGTTKGCYYFGAHMVARQGFEKVQIQGVEFAQMGQGGRLGHYPVHFHMVRQTPPGTFVKDSSVNESMTRWYVVHSTRGVTLARNVGWKSIGHGYYLEDATETDNNFYSNIGIFARAAVDNVQNNRKVPGILSYNGTDFPAFPYRSDNEHPSVFWITNGWNDFIGNMAAGAGTCGACYWFEPAENSDMPDVPDDLPVPANCPMDGMHTYMQWSGYAGLQKHQCVSIPQQPPMQPLLVSVPSAFAGTTPLKSFYKNYCTSAEHSFQTTQDAPACDGIFAANQGTAPNILTAVKSIAPTPTPTTQTSGEMDDPYYPHYIGARAETRCPLAATQIPGLPPQYDCSQALPCANGTAEEQCGVTVLDHYTSAFNWANGNVAAVWLRPKWYLVDNSVLSDVQNSGLTFVTSGTYDRTAVIEGDWALARNTVFIGATQPDNPYASNAGPFNQGGPQKSDLECEGGASPTDHCLNSNEGISMPLANFFVNQRLFSIYDGPSYEDSNTYLDITPTPCAGTDCMYAMTPGVRVGTGAQQCYLPNAAIGWKQPNGFFYPPAFHSTNLFLDNVAIRHYVIDALWNTNTYISNTGKIALEYCNPTGVSFGNYTDIDRQTELNDDDGSLTGLTNNVTPSPTGTISVNPLNFFSAPIETPECLSDLGVHPTATCDIAQQTPTTATTSPYDYVTTAVISQCGLDSSGGPNPGRCGDQTQTVISPPPNSDQVTMSLGRGGIWSQECTNPACYGVPLYRQFLTGVKGTDAASSTREWKDWYANKCDTNPTTTQCRFPFVRMSGQATYQRSTLTANHGTYYLDTTVPRDIQYGSSSTMLGEPFTDIIPCEFVLPSTGPCQPRSVNVFQRGQTYYVYFLYAKSGTHATQQTYQIFAGAGFNLNTDVNAVQANLDTSPVQAIRNQPWPAAWTKHYNDAVACPPTNLQCGILQVTVDFTDIDLSLSAANGLCQPHTFCKPNGSSCGVAFDTTDPRAQATNNPEKFVEESNYVCSEWAVKDLDFPGSEAFGFSFTLPAGFTPDATLTNPSPHRPLPTSFPTTATASTSKPDWTTKFTRTSREPDNASGGQCFYAKVPGTDCPVP